MDMSKYVALYLDESRQRLRQIRHILSEAHPDKELINELFRHLHTIKGMSASMGYESVTNLAHRLESLVVTVRDGERSLDRNLRITIQEGLEQFKYDFSVIEKGKPLVPALRVRSDILDEVLDHLGELFINNQQLQDALSNHNYLKMEEVSHNVSRELTSLSERIMAMRLTPISFLTDRLPEAVADLAKKLGKEVNLTINGDELEVDRAVLEALDAPLTQIIRNAIDHGLEKPELRQAAGKPTCGQLTVNLSCPGHRLVVTVTDDGQGINSQLLKEKALSRGLLTPEQADHLDERAALFLCCLPGLSTAAAPNDISGRGVGMDVVKANLESLGGHLEISSTLGQNSTFVMELPLSLALIQALLIHLEDQVLAVPLWQLAGTTIIDQFYLGPDGYYTTFRESIAPVCSLKEFLLPGSKTEIPPFAPALVINDGDQLRAFVVDKISSVEELVLKPLCDILAPLDCFSSTSLLANGRPILVLDLFKIAQQKLPS